MRSALDVAGTVEVARLERSGLVESRYLGAGVVVDASGAILRSVGDVDALIYPRSSLKPLQAVATLGTGIELTPVQAALAAASHAGSPRHRDVVQSILERAGLGIDDLQCPVDWPLDPHARDDLVRAGQTKSRLCMTCSGKHAAFLLACVHNGWPTDSYLDPAHPLQVHIRDVVEDLTGQAVEHSGIDGCGAPVHTVTLLGLARALSRIAGPDASDESRFLSDAIRSNAWAIDGAGRANTVLIERTGVVAKWGAEGVFILATPDGTAAAVKILDGANPPAQLVAVHLMASVGAIPPQPTSPALYPTL